MMDKTEHKEKLDKLFQKEKNTVTGRTVVDLKELYSSKKLAGLILTNPKLPVVPVFQGLEMGKGDYAWFTCFYDEPFVGEYWEDLWGRALHIKLPEGTSFLFGLDEMLEAVNDYYRDNFSLSSIEEEELKKKYEEIIWEKAIILPIWHIDKDPYSL
ncbi:MAG: hypothetical protein LUE87_08335 [Lachnospiraceae bacterium]|nr:hypothetical protein [Lachnospiraceae bacterium]